MARLSVITAFPPFPLCFLFPFLLLSLLFSLLPFILFHQKKEAKQKQFRSRKIPELEILVQPCTKAKYQMLLLKLPRSKAKLLQHAEFENRLSWQLGNKTFVNHPNPGLPCRLHCLCNQRQKEIRRVLFQFLFSSLLGFFFTLMTICNYIKLPVYWFLWLDYKLVEGKDYACVVYYWIPIA